MTHLGPYTDWVAAARLSRERPASSDDLTRYLAFAPREPEALDPRREKTWRARAIQAEEISWSCGYGPRTEAWLYYPAEMTRPCPGLVLLHDHGAFKYWGKEKVADGPEGMAAGLADFRQRGYGGEALATVLARAGYAVLVPDAFLWGSRRVPYECMPENDRLVGRLQFEELNRVNPPGWSALPEEVRRYNTAACPHEHTMAKYATVLGTTLAGIVSFEDTVAARYLKSRSDVCDGWIGCVGLSGGGMRSALLRGTCDLIQAAVVVGAMSTYEGLLDTYIDVHTWLLFPPALARAGDWPDVVARRFASPVLVQYDADDELFSLEGMQAADEKLRAAFASSPHPGCYRGEFYPGPHKFDRAMQEAAIAWLRSLAR
ncbi:MAG TPA: hypothetical protein VHY09_08125 [Candidatus Methylacidiphilales bacterium]|jgi:dienelactone hydrolase|nr:hypothetical protein [Candidatus Methylacidiphilales bacterium]